MGAPVDHRLPEELNWRSGRPTSEPVARLTVDAIATAIADGVCAQCNTVATHAMGWDCLYKSQFLLEEVIKKLQSRV